MDRAEHRPAYTRMAEGLFLYRGIVDGYIHGSLPRPLCVGLSDGRRLSVRCMWASLMGRCVRAA